MSYRDCDECQREFNAAYLDGIHNGKKFCLPCFQGKEERGEIFLWVNPETLSETWLETKDYPDLYKQVKAKKAEEEKNN